MATVDWCPQLWGPRATAAPQLAAVLPARARGRAEERARPLGSQLSSPALSASSFSTPVLRVPNRKLFFSSSGHQYPHRFPRIPLGSPATLLRLAPPKSARRQFFPTPTLGFVRPFCACACASYSLKKGRPFGNIRDLSHPRPLPSAWPAPPSVLRGGNCPPGASGRGGARLRERLLGAGIMIWTWGCGARSKGRGGAMWRARPPASPDTHAGRGDRGARPLPFSFPLPPLYLLPQGRRPEAF